MGTPKGLIIWVLPGVALLSMILVGLLVTLYFLLSLVPVGVSQSYFPWVVFAVFLATLCFMGIVLDYNELALHSFYRDRLAEAYMRTLRWTANTSGDIHIFLRDSGEMPLWQLHGIQDSDPKKCATSAPLHLFVTCLNFTRSQDLMVATRRSDHFFFSKLYCGSRVTGFMETNKYRGGTTTVADAMAISGAAVNPLMGRRTRCLVASALTIFNIRLGQWIEKPHYRISARAHSIYWPKYLFMEFFARTSLRHRLVNLSDGGHTGDNLGILPLLERRCRLIVVVDAEWDPAYKFESFVNAIRQTIVDYGAEIEIDVQLVRPDSNTRLSKCHSAVGQIHYPYGELGWLVLVKSSLTGDEPKITGNYQAKEPEFPHRSTSDQFFNEEQFDAYRSLGQHMIEHAFGVEIRKELRRRGWEEDWDSELSTFL
jgi:hypothetical protein